MNTIPHVIHQTWRDDNVPPYLQPFQVSWTNNHPAWHYRLWTDETNRQLIAEHCPEFLPTYDAYPFAIQRADAARYFILYYVGGLYVDLDMECLRPVDSLLAGRSCVLGAEPRAHALAHGTSIIIGNAVMASTPGHQLWPAVQEALVRQRHARDPWGRLDVLRSTGPLMLTEVVQQYGNEGVTLYPPDVFYPHLDAVNRDNFSAWSKDAALEQSRYMVELRQGTVPPESYAIHHWAGTWTSSREEKQALIEEITGRF